MSPGKRTIRPGCRVEPVAIRKPLRSETVRVSQPVIWALDSLALGPGEASPGSPERSLAQEAQTGPFGKGRADHNPKTCIEPTFWHSESLRTPPPPSSSQGRLGRTKEPL